VVRGRTRWCGRPRTRLCACRPGDRLRRDSRVRRRGGACPRGPEAPVSRFSPGRAMSPGCGLWRPGW
jgi:hypothetical protein